MKQAALLALLIAAGVIALSLVPLPAAIDWDETFRPAVLAWLSGGNPYHSGAHPLYNPPWVLLPLLPFAVLPYEIGRAALLLASLAAFATVAKRFGASPLSMAFFLLCIPVWDSFTLGNVEWLVMLGLIVPRPAGMVLLAIKPQAGAVVMLFYAVEAIRSGGLRGIVRLLFPLAVVGALSLVMFGAWPIESMRYLAFRGEPMNYSFFPYTIPLGLALVIAAIRKRDIRYALPASPCFFPVVTPMSWGMAFLPIVGAPLEMAAATVSLWVIALFNGRPI